MNTKRTLQRDWYLHVVQCVGGFTHAEQTLEQCCYVSQLRGGFCLVLALHGRL